MLRKLAETLRDMEKRINYPTTVTVQADDYGLRVCARVTRDHDRKSVGYTMTFAWHVLDAASDDDLVNEFIRMANSSFRRIEG